MLTDASYHTALYVYCGAAVVALLLMAFCLRKVWGRSWRLLLVLLGAAQLLTPAYPHPGEETMAPALIVVGFQMLTDGLDSATHALRPLSYAAGLAVVLTLIARFTVFRRGQGAEPETQPEQA